ncbi:cbb3-type cytochrome oxidase subunit 3 [Hydrogenophaga sp.]|uniref:cbb3-type cytochrome oxidase subunit 3 n=1 Tax=Hydrogenophaga sp. TaxID=1904254 RepID=UPI00356AD0C8
MDINDLRSAVTVLSLLTFLGIVFWAWSGRRQSSFDEAAQLPFQDEQPSTSTREPS